MINYALVDSRTQLNDFTRNLLKMIDSTKERGVSYMIRTRSGTVLRTDELEHYIAASQNHYFRTKDNSAQWFADGSCQCSSELPDHFLSSNDLISSEEI